MKWVNFCLRLCTIQLSTKFSSDQGAPKQIVGGIFICHEILKQKRNELPLNGLVGHLPKIVANATKVPLAHAPAVQKIINLWKDWGVSFFHQTAHSSRSMMVHNRRNQKLKGSPTLKTPTIIIKAIIHCKC